MSSKLLVGIACGCAIVLGLALALGSMSMHSKSGNAGALKSKSSLSSSNQTIDVDHPPASISVAKGGTITLVRYGTSKTTVNVTSYATDGKGELLMKLGGGPNGTVATFRALRNGRGVIRIASDKPGPGGALLHTINVTVE